MTVDKVKPDERCEKKKVIEEEPTDIICECTKTVHLGETCSCGIKHEKVVKEKDECADPWTGYERGKKKR